MSNKNMKDLMKLKRDMYLTKISKYIGSSFDRNKLKEIKKNILNIRRLN